MTIATVVTKPVAMREVDMPPRIARLGRAQRGDSARPRFTATKFFCETPCKAQERQQGNSKLTAKIGRHRDSLHRAAMLPQCRDHGIVRTGVGIHPLQS